MFFYYSEKEKRYTDQLNFYLKQSNEDVFFLHMNLSQLISPSYKGLQEDQTKWLAIILA